MQRTETAHSYKINASEEILVKIRSEQTKEAYRIIEHRGAANAAPPLHLHRNEDEIFEILEGQIRFCLDGDIIEASPGTTVAVPRNMPHTWADVGGIPSRMIVTFVPGGFDRFFQAMESIPHTDPRAPILGEEHGCIYLGPPMEV
ncbi:MAG TPA: cupin domain-containing protein [Chthoniobacterales bacterium]|nr:cupin domain-containing protein [Chthoniobacterales bacterium]